MSALHPDTGYGARRVLVGLALVTSIATPVCAQRQPAPRPIALRYEIRPHADSLPGVELRLIFPAGRDSVIALRLPNSWAGREHLYRDIEDLRTLEPDARLERESDSSRVRVHRPPNSAVTIAWHLRGTREPVFTPEGHNHDEITPRWVQLVGSDALIVPDGPDGRAIDLTLAFRGFPRGPVATSFGSGVADTTIRARGIVRDLSDAVYTIGVVPGALRMYTTSIGGHVVHVVVRDSLLLADSTLVAVVRNTIRSERTFWDDPGPPDYLVSIGPDGRGSLGGVRLTGAFIADIDRAVKETGGIAQLFGHELMHEWMGGALRPAVGVPDGTLSWFTEGFDEYLTHRVLWLGGALNDSAYVATIDARLREHALSSDRNASWTDIVPRYWTSSTAKRQPYLRGELFALRWSALLDSATGRVGTLDILLRRAVGARGGRRVALTDSSIAALIAGPLGLARARFEMAMGLDSGRIVLPPSTFGHCAAIRIDTIPVWDPGFDIDASLASNTIQSVRMDGPAARAGLENGMRIAGRSIYFGRTDKPIVLQVRADSAVRRFEYLPVGDRRVDVQTVTMQPGCALPR